ncbi:MAG: hypothetical protein AAFR96_02580 [Planctomycetota bacterium]
MSDANQHQQLPSLTDDLGDIAAPRQPAGPRPGPIQRLIASQTSTPERAKRLRSVGGGIIGLALGGAIVWGVLSLIPVQQPDFDAAELDRVLGYALLTDDFDALPLDDRIELIGQVVKRLESMDAEEGTLMAAFAAGIVGQARDQLEKNASGVVIDMWDEIAPGYQGLATAEEREAYLERATVDLIRMFERLDGDPTTKTDEELLADARAQAERDRERFADPARGPSPSGVARFAGFMNREIGDRTTPHQKARITKISRDMTRFLRGESLGD